MNPAPKHDPAAIRSDIDETRRRMDDTMDALGDRLQPRHLLDEFLGFLRGSAGDGETRLTHMRDKLSRSAETAMHSVADTVKKNPMPALLIGAGVAWMIYETNRKSRGVSDDLRANQYPYDERMRYDPDLHYDRPLEYPPSIGAGAATQWSDQGSKVGELKEKIGDKASAAAEQVKEKVSQAGEVAREKMGALRERAGETLHAARERAGELTDRVREGTREAYTRTRERVVQTADQHPLEVGLAALAAGLLAGLALPTPAAVHRTVGPAADRLRERTRETGAELLEKGKRVARAAASAAKDEAQAQGLTPERLGQAQPEGGTPVEGNQSGSQQNDPTLARPPV